MGSNSGVKIPYSLIGPFYAKMYHEPYVCKVQELINLEVKGPFKPFLISKPLIWKSDHFWTAAFTVSIKTINVREEIVISVSLSERVAESLPESGQFLN